MSLEEKLRVAQEDLQKCVNDVNMFEQAKQEATQRAVRADERVKIYTEMIKEQNAPKEPEATK